ncbi:hypothetical protein LINGRAHAP2_LOCUS22546 [Linum grandiflorum]
MSLPENIISSGPPAIVWPLKASYTFSVDSLRFMLTQEKFPGDPFFPYTTIWFREVPNKVQGFCWKVFLKKIASQENL